MAEDKLKEFRDSEFYRETLITQRRVADAALIRNYGNLSKTARELNINRGSLRKLIKENKPVGLQTNKETVHGK